LKKHRPFLHSKKVLAFLVSDPFFSRSICFCIQQVMEAFMELEEGNIKPYSRRLYDALHSLKTDLQVTPMESVMKQGLHSFLVDIQNRCNQIGRLITETYYLGELPAL
ncbi:MAG TPA: alpha-E domain-containing protein, partial [Bacillales bacterium]|nr:alpha-E domain-containing protein [Bacillales bacterium]